MYFIPLIGVGLFFFLRINIMNYIQKKFFLYESLFLPLICFYLCYFDIKINPFLIYIVFSIIIFL